MSTFNPIKTTTTLTILFCCSIFLGACDKKVATDAGKVPQAKALTTKVTPKVDKEQHEEHAHEEEAHKEHEHEQETVVPKLKLNGDKKWKANIKTTQGVTKLSSIAEVGMKMENPSAEDIKMKVQELQLTFQNIFKECTMKGASHDQLHHFLVPVDGMLKKISASDGTTAPAIFKTLHEHLTIYPTYFE